MKMETAPVYWNFEWQSLVSAAKGEHENMLQFQLWENKQFSSEMYLPRWQKFVIGRSGWHERKDNIYCRYS